ncbi:MAG: hypothetical protein LBK06_06765, partial [Planctomycetaceae bacterium]|nr:hypothetical protein [Planctomycetaceae bacterium]
MKRLFEGEAYCLTGYGIALNFFVFQLFKNLLSVSFVVKNKLLAVPFSITLVTIQLPNPNNSALDNIALRTASAYTALIYPISLSSQQSH